MSLRSPRGTQVRAGSWVRIRAGRVGRRVFLSVSGRPVSNWLLPGQAGDWSGGTAPLYIGEHQSSAVHIILAALT